MCRRRVVYVERMCVCVGVWCIYIHDVCMCMRVVYVERMCYV